MYRHFFKRVFDFILSLIILILAGWLLLIVAIWLHFANKGSGAFFLQERPGRNGKLFKVIKFKTMTDERDESGGLLPDEKRITNVGRFVRSSSIDELPQLLNVLKGDMALIGPRPLLVKYMSYYTEREKLRFSVRPGISGWAQVNGRNTISWDKKLSYDVEYVEKLSFMMDVRILLKTIRNVLSRKDVVLQAIPDLDEYRKNENVHVN